MLNRDRNGNAREITLTGWLATLGMSALVICLTYGSYVLYQRYRGFGDAKYTVVVKQQYK
eukprot:gene15209-21285_t